MLIIRNTHLFIYYILVINILQRIIFNTILVFHFFKVFLFLQLCEISEISRDTLTLSLSSVAYELLLQEF